MSTHSTPPAPLPAALLIVRGGGGFAVFDASDIESPPEDLPAADAIALCSDVVALSSFVRRWDEASAEGEIRP